ncbi:MAG: hypothetical protein RBG13Loki_1672 [Promethearchaeota archaeon CR_4]|nr:MAG: hypothetical protein RBG13Loki_1672 [Candidatus Lokiarchaeota archaeon CR_4]
MTQQETKESKAAKITMVFFLAAFAIGVWSLLSSGDDTLYLIARVLHIVLSVITILAWIMAIKRQEAIATVPSEVLFVAMNILGVCGALVPASLIDDILMGFHKFFAFLTLVLWIVAIWKSKKE